MLLPFFTAGQDVGTILVSEDKVIFFKPVAEVGPDQSVQQIDIPTCHVCGESGTVSSRLKRCSCMKVDYCSKECQKSDWKCHKANCTADKKNVQE